MANVLTGAGLTTKTYAELLAEITSGLQAIYGADINLDPSSPDAQLMMIYIQSTLDNLDLLKQIYNSFDPDSAFGVTLDRRVGINGIQRQVGTNTLTAVSVTVDRALNLYGDDQTINPPFEVADNAGSRWILTTTENILSAGVYSLIFKSATVGANLSVPNTINTPISIVLGVTSVNNPSVYISLGLDEETDANLKIRRLKSVALSSQGYLAGLQASLQNINGVTFTKVLENKSDTTDTDGIPSHSIWVIVGGSGDPALIADAIYKKRNAGCGMKGAESYTIIQPDSSSFVVNWDNVVSEDVYVQFNATSLDGINPPKVAEILNAIPLLYIPSVYEKINITKLASIVQSIDPNCYIDDAGFSLNILGPYTNTLLPSVKNGSLVFDSSNINLTVV